jgi:hypothetical protein
MRNYYFFGFLLLVGVSLSGSAFPNDQPWKTVKNKYGFNVSYPGDWEATDPEGEGSPANSRVFQIQGPLSEIKQGKRWVQFDIGCFSPQQNQNSESAREWVLKQLLPPGTKKLSERSFSLGGESAYEITIFDSNNYESHVPTSRGGVSKMAAVLHHGSLCYVGYAEMGTDTQKMRSDKEWKYQDHMEKIISSFKFTK